MLGIKLLLSLALLLFPLKSALFCLFRLIFFIVLVSLEKDSGIFGTGKHVHHILF